MSYARDWAGRVEWRADSLGTVKGFGKVVRMTPNDWCRVSDRDVAGYLQLMREKVAGNWRVRHVRAHAEKRASRAEWSLDELGNDAADGVAGRVRDGLVRDLRRYEVQTAEWQRQVDARGDGEEAEVEQPDWARPLDSTSVPSLVFPLLSFASEALPQDVVPIPFFRVRRCSPPMIVSEL